MSSLDPNWNLLTGDYSNVASPVLEKNESTFSFNFKPPESNFIFAFDALNLNEFTFGSKEERTMKETTDTKHEKGSDVPFEAKLKKVEDVDMDLVNRLCDLLLKQSGFSSIQMFNFTHDPSENSDLTKSTESIGEPSTNGLKTKSDLSLEIRPTTPDLGPSIVMDKIGESNLKDNVIVKELKAENVQVPDKANPIQNSDLKNSTKKKRRNKNGKVDEKKTSEPKLIWRKL